MCTVGAYRTCLQTDAQLWARARELEAAQPEISPRRGGSGGMVYLLATHCHEGCTSANSCDASRARAKGGEAALKSFRRRCAPYRKLVNYTDELPDMLREAAASRGRLRGHNFSLNAASGALDRVYLRHSMGHRFCLVAPGDTWSTKKIAEVVALGGAGGCIPVLVVPYRRGDGAGRGQKLARFLPYTSWLDWCSIAYLISADAARTGMAAIVSKLAAVTEVEAQKKLAALRAARDAFVCRSPEYAATTDYGRRPSAPDYLLGVACDAAKRAASDGAARDAIVIGGDHQRCLLG